MGTFTKADVYITFKNDVPNVFENRKSLNATLRDFHTVTNPNHTGRVDIDIDSTTIDGEVAILDIASERYSHCEFQIDLVRDYLVANYPNEVFHFDCTGWTAADDLGGNYDSDGWAELVAEA